jgi:hypothetical protein
VLAESRVAAVLAHVGAEDELRELLARLPDEVWREQINAGWLAQALWLVGNAELAERLYPLVELYERRWAMYWFDCEVTDGPSTRLLAYVAGLRGRWDECDRFFEHARAALDAAGWRSLGARARFEMGDLLARAGRDGARARSLLGEARAMAAGVGLPELVDLIDRRHPALRSRVSTRPSAPEAPPPAFAMDLEGEYYVVTGGAGPLRFKATRGMRYLARLVERPSIDVHVLDLATTASDSVDRGDAGELLDAPAFRAYRDRLTALREALEDAEERGDRARAERARDEMDAIASEITRATGAGGRARRGESAVDRARSAVQRRIKDALDRIGESDPDLGGWLRRVVRTGNYCSYRPAD